MTTKELIIHLLDEVNEDLQWRILEKVFYYRFNSYMSSIFNEYKNDRITYNELLNHITEFSKMITLYIKDKYNFDLEGSAELAFDEDKQNLKFEKEFKQSRFLSDDKFTHRHLEDVKELQARYAKLGYNYPLEQCANIWEDYSDRYAAGWLGMGDENDIINFCKQNLQ